MSRRRIWSGIFLGLNEVLFHCNLSGVGCVAEFNYGNEILLFKEHGNAVSNKYKKHMCYHTWRKKAKNAKRNISRI